MSGNRRDFLRTLASAVPALAVPGAAAAAPPAAAPAPPAGRAAEALDPALLAALAAAVLPSELGEAGTRRAAAAFDAWARAYEPSAELPHGYGSAALQFTPPDPTPAWAAQLRALDAAARRERGAGFAALAAADAREVARAAIGADAPERLPVPYRAGHVAVALLAHFYATPAATDLCYGRRVAPLTCRGLGNVKEAPAPLSGAGGRP